MSFLFRAGLLALLLIVQGCATPIASRPAPIVVLVSIDGLPAAVPGTGRMPVLDAIAREGVQAAWLQPSYPTLTFPNHYTLATGLRPDRHGIVNNNINDAVLGRYVSKQASARDGRWYGGEPIWATLQRQGGIAATMFWPGSEAEIAGQRPRYWKQFDGTLPVDARVDQVLAWLDLPTAQRPRLLTLYLEQYDVASHAAGARSQPAMQALATVDAGLARLRDGLRARGLDESVDLIVLSDHGMADVRAEDARYLDDIVPADTMDVESVGQMAWLRARPGREAEVERALVRRHDHFQCWRKGETPASWHFGRNPRIPAIVCQADDGWRVWLHRWPTPTTLKGEHGFAPEDIGMRAVFTAVGPSFRTGVRLPAFDNVDVYPLLARLLRITPAPNDGDIAPLLPALQDDR
ncbi:ectonucleotide pyrophosphatase/phosphodiesterase [Thermomonas carbonis]|uniref:Alkaline phosphatase family protein n=1 Tax=Thermomonas carbonis TaxID=1463158 RepID=A0A7G9SM82_9GAMM|nr:ectonucleotide pyrophosphatase/phosphodiesterase [Thermomonas carbonis]QNN68957.1 alkaline phosphatase family protein [Thermomonas carbonis]GHC07672.1 alkaline phosphatase family protein [Thermomonas carbonis]